MIHQKYHAPGSGLVCNEHVLLGVIKSCRAAPSWVSHLFISVFTVPGHTTSPQHFSSALLTVSPVGSPDLSYPVLTRPALAMTLELLYESGGGETIWWQVGAGVIRGTVDMLRSRAWLPDQACMGSSHGATTSVHVTLSSPSFLFRLEQLHSITTSYVIGEIT